MTARGQRLRGLHPSHQRFEKVSDGMRAEVHADKWLNEGFTSVNDGLPDLPSWVLVITPYFRCVARLDAEKKWCRVNNEQVPDVQAWKYIA